LSSVLNGNASSPEVVAVDNASSDGTADLIARQFPRVKLLRNHENKGFSKAVNQGITASSGRLIFLLNPDAKVKKGALRKMIDFASSDDKVGVVGPRLTSPEGVVQEEAQRFPTLWPMVFWLFRLHRIPPFPNLPPLENFLLKGFDYEKTQEVEHLMGAALLLKREMLKDIGLLDEGFWFWFEETDLQKRAWQAGWKVVYYPRAEVTHLVGESTKKVNPFRLQAIWNRSLRYYFKKHRPTWERVVLEPFIWVSYLPIPLFFLGKKLLRR
jgi:GT2 family glycosyltransferase